MSEPELPLPEGKASFKPDELYRYTKVKPFVLRFWESEFPSLKPRKIGKDGLAYTRADVEMILAIKHLLYDKGLTLAEARKQLCGDGDEKQGATPAVSGDPKKKPQKKKTRKTAAKPVLPAPESKTRVAAPDGKPEPQKPVKSAGRRGLPVAGSNRSAVSFEDLLPNSQTSQTGDVGKPTTGRKKPRAKAGGGSGAPAGTVAVAADPGQNVLGQKLSEVLVKLRGILTLLDKGDR